MYIHNYICIVHLTRNLPQETVRPTEGGDINHHGYINIAANYIHGGNNHFYNHHDNNAMLAVRAVYRYNELY